MESNNPTPSAPLAKDLMDVVIRIGLIALLIFLSFRTFAPFMGLMLWALILAVALYPLQQKLAAKTGGRQGRAATILVLVGLLLIGLPTVMLGSSFAGHIQSTYEAFDNNNVELFPPEPSVAQWPLVGQKVFDTWSAAAENLPATLEKFKPQLTDLSKKLVGAAASTAGAVLAFLGSLIIAGIMMAYGQSGSRSMERIACRVSGPAKGPKLHRLTVATIRSVAVGVIGVAFIQALLLGVGFIMAGVPGAGILAIVVLLIGILQLPALIVSLPVIAYLWGGGDASVTANIFFTVYLLLAGMADNVLKPLLLGRGVDVPMPVILLGALGGMISGGMIGLFLGAVVLAVGYQIFMEWVNEDDAQPMDEGPAAGPPGKSGEVQTAGE